MTTDQIIAATTCHDHERLRYEVEKPTNAKVYRTATFVSNSKGELIALFIVKAWKQTTPTT